MFHGSIVALITPFKDDLSIDYDALAKLIDMHKLAKTNGIVVAGTTGESGSLTAAEKRDLVKFAVKQVDECMPVIVGTGTSGTQSSIELSAMAMHEGADAVLLMSPAYVKPTQEGLFQHFKSIAHAVALPQIIYNIPSRTCCDILPETVERLAGVSNIIGIKEASGSIERVQEILKRCGDSIDVYSGEDEQSKDLMFVGAKGVISVTANVAPDLMVQMCAAALAKDQDLATTIDQKLQPLHLALFLETNPIPVKWAAHSLGWCSAKMRLPLTELSEQYHQPLEQALREANVL